jgi:hypothetical protein
MNQNQIVEKLLLLDKSVESFILTLSGKASSKVDGLYKPLSKEIIIHNKNHADDNQLMYTAIHEFAHHIQFTRSSKPVSSRSHTIDFWNILHKLLNKAEELGIYTNIFEKEDEFKNLTKEIKDNYLSKNGKIMKDMASLLVKAHELCLKYHTSFDDYMDRILGLHRSTAKTVMRFQNLSMDPQIGYEKMKIIASIKDEDVRNSIQKAFMEGQTQDSVKAMLRPPVIFEDKFDRLMKEKDRLEKLLENVTAKLDRIDKEIKSLKPGGKNN